MTQAQFMYDLMTAVKDLSDEEKYVIMNDYNQYFFDKKEAGLSEEEIVAALPSPKSIAEDYHHGIPTPIDGMDFGSVSENEDKKTPLSILLFILLMPVCAVYEALAVVLGIAAAVVMLALCIAAAFASVGCFGLAGLSRGFILVGIGGLLLTVALVLLSAAMFRAIAAGIAWFPRFMKRVLNNRKA